VTIKYIIPANDVEAYSVDVMKLALSHVGEKSFVYQPVHVADTIRAQFNNVNPKDVDIFWLFSNSQLEEQLLPIRIPIDKGLLGYKVLLIREGDQARFDKISTVGDLKKITIGQRLWWPEVELLRANGFTVYTPSKFDSLMYMLDGGRFDAFPRWLFEPYSDISKHKNLNLTVEKKILLSYVLPYYFFVASGNKVLASDIETGLNRAIQDGTFDNLFLNSVLVDKFKNKIDTKSRQIFTLDNPLIPKGVPTNNFRYWFDPRAL
jgi:ABC-type amino acid transport substrate-binding protein